MKENFLRGKVEQPPERGTDERPQPNLLRIAIARLPPRNTVLFTLLTVGAFLLIQNVNARPLVMPQALNSSSTTVSYQGRLTDSVGNPITGTLGSTFRIYNVPTGGVPLWTEAQPSLSIQNGLFQVLLGSSN